MWTNFYLFKSWIYIHITNPLKTWRKTNKLFKSPKIKFHIGTDFYIGNIFIDHRYPHRKILNFKILDVGFKMKWDEPRYEHNPYICIDIFNKFRFLIEFKSPTDILDDNLYWEMILEYVYLYNDLIKLKNNFGWVKYIIDQYGDKITISCWTDEILTEKGKHILYE